MWAQHFFLPRAFALFFPSFWIIISFDCCNMYPSHHSGLSSNVTFPGKDFMVLYLIYSTCFSFTRTHYISCLIHYLCQFLELLFFWLFDCSVSFLLKCKLNTYRMLVCLILCYDYSTEMMPGVEYLSHQYCRING